MNPVPIKDFLNQRAFYQYLYKLLRVAGGDGGQTTNALGSTSTSSSTSYLQLNVSINSAHIFLFIFYLLMCIFYNFYHIHY